ncbi:isoflavone reductase [Bifidobacterium minimum]|uniref:Isoflavone reductase n=1 Tax=Bifidobacterium minimum TaxID=1693 RepID=A0A087BTB8_9BIFI|nr:SDR family oxidoreductase [Bifidobacterium minimum]KFI74268.1 isoflavone reductase [Bifidobacterium minimum]
MTVLVTGATGGFGGYAIDALESLIPSDEIIGLARSKEKAERLTARGVAIRIGDYSDSDSLEAAFDGIDRLLFVSGAPGAPGERERQHENVVKAAKKAGVTFIAYTSFAQATAVDNMLSADHVATERRIEESGISHTFLRNNWYLENELTLIDVAKRTGTLPYAAGDATIGWALKSEYARAAAIVVSGTVRTPKILELSGAARSYADLAAALGRILGAPIKPLPLTTEDFIRTLEATGLPQSAASGLAGVQKLIAHGDLEVLSNDFEKTLGHPLTPLDEALRAILK